MAAPMNMEELNRKLRMQKQAEHRARKEAADNMRVHHMPGVKEEDLSLSKMRKEDWQKRQESQMYLHSYKKKEELEARKRQEREQLNYPPLAERKEDDTLDSIAMGSVHAMTDKFSSPGKESTDHVSRDLKDWSLSGNGAPPLTIEEEQENTSPGTPVPAYVEHTAETPAMSELGSPPASMAPPSHLTPDDDAPSNGSVVVPATPKSDEQEEQTSIPPLIEAPTDERVDVLSPAGTTVAGAVVRLDILFSFGLVTSAQEPTFKNYMRAVEKIIKGTSITNVYYDPGFKPFVKSWDFDEDWQDKSERKQVRRVVVIAAVPVFLTKDVTIAQARDGVVEALQKSIENGSFIAIAQSKKDAERVSSSSR